MNRKQINKIIQTILPLPSSILGAPLRRMNLEKYAVKFPQKAEFKKESSLDEDVTIIIPEFFYPKDILLPHQFFNAILTDARVWGRNGAVIADGDVFINDVSREFVEKKGVDHSIFYTLKEIRSRELKGNVAVIGTAGAYVYYHWMLDILPRIGLLTRALPIEKIDFFITEFTKLPFQQETLKDLNIPVDKILSSNNNWKFHIHAQKLFVPSLVGPMGQPTKFQIDYLRKMYGFYFSDGPPFRKIYISRRKTGRREIVNEKEIIEYLKHYNFEIIECEMMRVKEQVKLFSEASVVIGSHGSAFTNLVFCKTGTKVLDIFNISHTNPCFFIISGYLNLDYHFISGESIPIDNNPKSDNTLLRLEKFIEAFEKLNVQKEF